jgi:hypothetical protein
MAESGVLEAHCNHTLLLRYSRVAHRQHTPTTCNSTHENSQNCQPCALSSFPPLGVALGDTQSVAGQHPKKGRIC